MDKARFFIFLIVQWFSGRVFALRLVDCGFVSWPGCTKDSKSGTHKLSCVHNVLIFRNSAVLFQECKEQKKNTLVFSKEQSTLVVSIVSLLSLYWSTKMQTDILS